jgi:hypothetical protein
MIETLEMTPEEQAVWREIDARPGREQSIALGDLAVLVGIAPRVVQWIVKHLIERHACAIGSATGTPHGYYRITSFEDLEKSRKQLEHRIIRTAQRLAALNKNTPAECLGQIQLALNEG